MATQIQMLALSPTMEQATIVKWRKKENDPVAPNEVLCEVETDKATMDFESAQSGTLLKILVPESGQARVGDPIAIIGSPGEDISNLTAPQQKPYQPAQPAQQQPSQPTTENNQSSIINNQLKSSPAARKLAAEKGIDIRQIPGTGPDGRITERDVISYSPTAKINRSSIINDQLKDETIPLTQMRKTIAARLTQSKFSAPDFYVRLNVSAQVLIDSRTALNNQLARKVSINAFLIKLAAMAIAKHPQINSSWNNDSIIRHSRIDIALAVATEAGLVAPVVRNCLYKGIITIDTQLTNLIAKAKSAKLTPADYENSTFTISNLGSFGIDEFTAIINPPNAAILAIGAIDRKPHINEKDELTIRPEMTLTLTADHRIIDGALAAQFLRDLKKIIESPLTALY
ncbi:MAG: hypothetical protein A2Y07_07050 [Planctomycetes bacterium GWF2_50_10]|nr:MAG: hypothetical protein A2Y07_07050 [Planctomycetes bacterium GWF2_50_10]